MFCKYFIVAGIFIVWLPASAAMARPIALQSERANVLEHNGTCKNKHRLRHNGKYRKHCKEQHGMELKKK